MRVAVLSDLHANAQALEAVMNDVVSQNCEHVFCLGDIALAGPQPKEVTDYVMAQNTWTVIQGNTDKMIAQYGPQVVEFLEAQYPVMANAISDDVLKLDDAHRAYLANLPPMLSLDVEGCSVLLVHGSPRANNEDILPGMPLEIIEEIVEETKEKLILCGHTHIPCGYQTNRNQTIVNVGSVGRPMTQEPKACYAIIDFSQGSFEVRHRFVEYDNKLAAQIMSQRGFVGADRLADLLLNPVERHI
jgi:putative phosphoesterase